MLQKEILKEVEKHKHLVIKKLDETFEVEYKGKLLFILLQNSILVYSDGNYLRKNNKVVFHLDTIKTFIIDDEESFNQRCLSINELLFFYDYNKDLYEV